MKKNKKCFEIVCEVMEKMKLNPKSIDQNSLEILQEYCIVIDEMTGYQIEALEVEITESLAVIIRLSTYYAELSPSDSKILELIRRGVCFNIYSTNQVERSCAVLEFTFPSIKKVQ